MKFTILGKKVDSLVKNQLDAIVEEIKGNLPSVKSIMLGGGFGQGEGAVKVKGNKIYPYNDYDIYVITEENVDPALVDGIACKASKKIGYTGIQYFYNFKKEEQLVKKNFYVDLKCMTKEKLKKMLPRLRTYSLKKTGLILYGKDYRYLIPDYDLKDIPLSEPAKFLLDRMSQMVEYYSTKKVYCRDYLTFIIQQSYAAMSTALVMLLQKYKPSYHDNMRLLLKEYKRNFPELYKKLPDLHLRIEKYSKWKLNPQNPPERDVQKLWLTGANDLLEVSKYFFSKYLKKEISNVDQLSQSIIKMAPRFYMPYLNHTVKKKIGFSLGGLIIISMPLLYFFLKRAYNKRLEGMINKNYIKVYFNRYSPDLYIFASVPYIISAIGPRGVNETMLNKAKKLLSKVYPVKSKDWEGLSLEYANAYIAFFMQKLG